MTDPGYPSTTYQPLPSTPAKSEIPMWTLWTAGAFAVIGAVILAFVVLGELNEDEKKNYPDAWDPRIAPYAKIAEKHRGLNFFHPVEVRFLERDAFAEEVTSDAEDLEDDDRKEIEQSTSLLRAIGLITGDVDLFAAFNDASGGGTLGFYSFKDERITMRGEELTPAAKATLVHELVHVLQDQHFAIGERLEELREKDAANSEESVLRAIIEGDAERVANLYRESLTPEQRKAQTASENKQRDEASEEFENIPKTVLAIIGSPYTLGQSLVTTVAEKGGNAAVDALYRDTPVHDDALFDPFGVLAGDLEADEVDPPKLRDGETEVDTGAFGALSWYFMLAERMPLLQALDAVDGWGGDAYVHYEKGGVSCVRAAYRGDTEADTPLMLTALETWVAAAPGTPAEVAQDGDTVLFESCDPGTDATVGKEAAIDALTLLSIRNQYGTALLKSGVPEIPASCIAGRIIQTYSLAQLSDPAFGANDSTVQNQLRQFAMDCR